MKIRFLTTGKIEDIYDRYAERLIEQGRAVVAVEEDDFPMNPPEPVKEEPEKKEKPKSRKKGE